MAYISFILQIEMNSQNKTLPTATKVEAFLASLNHQQQQDSRQLIHIMQSISGEPPIMWGSNIIGFGTYHYRYASGREGDWMKLGFSPRKDKLSLYITGDAAKYATELQAMGKHKIGKGCIYIKHLADVDIHQLTKIIALSFTANDRC